MMHPAVASLAVFGGAGFGAVGRYWISIATQERWGNTFPWGTLAVNLIGSFAIGVTFALLPVESRHPGWRLFIAPGLLGGFTTFSAFSIEAMRMMESGRTGWAAIYALSSVIFGLACCWVGLSLGRALA